MENCIEIKEAIPETIKDTVLECPSCGHKHSFSGYTEDKNIVRCPKCNKVHNIIK